MNEKTKGILLGAAIMVVLVSAAGVVLASGWGISGGQRAMMFEKRAQLISENVPVSEFRAQMREYASTIGINNTGCGGFEDKDGDGRCDYNSDCPMHVNGTALCGGPNGAGGPFASGGGYGCHGSGAIQAGDDVGGSNGDGGCPFHKTGNTERLGGRQGCPFHNQ